MSKQEQLQAVIDQLRVALPDLKGAMIASTDGLPIATALSRGSDPNRIAAMSATALGLGKRISDTVGVGEFSETSVSGKDGQIYLYSVGSKAVLALVAPLGANVGLIHLEARDSARSISDIL
ncbi:roadblock/LC7 domain-containing protein [Deinococcus yavapaiensis]|uniref:Roadblock/LAMTOR2 domain-containing protein n=2 Tax=Deinococcus yavapaiensis KR-236 TaxID=694435 RepID=A0A318SMK3_9DEIO|nr:roadblock/LC7 domain-containing protein [Deinococcus yavapaiensis]PYE53761.1 hypothetical protein DES52_10719 [Deinococcus yavapaiensis KR-236]PYE53764.1 hypothetical protein DES52_10722 [Deinococcus yavapaiensis KR-236]